VAGGATVSSAAPLERIPVHVRAGSIVPFGPDLQYTSEKAADPIALYVFAGADGHFELYEDDGSSYAYESGGFTRIPIAWNDATSTLTLGAREGAYAGMLASRTFDIVVVRPPKAVPAGMAATYDRTVTYDGAAAELVLP